MNRLAIYKHGAGEKRLRRLTDTAIWAWETTDQ